LPNNKWRFDNKKYVLLLLADEKCRWFDMEEERGVLDRENKERFEGCLT
jgi:hypothetical protein